jgi:photosystem II stability/assembly factor-like uncharacterized protein
MVETVVAIGTRKGLWLARSTDRDAWAVEGPHFLMSEVAAVAFDVRRERPRILAGVMSWHWGPTVQISDDGGRTWTEEEQRAIAFDKADDTALKRVWQLVPDPHDDQVVWAGGEPHSLWRSDDGGESFSLNRALWEHPHHKEWGEGFGGGAIHTVVPDPSDPQELLVAMSTGGAYRSTDGGASWHATNRGISAYFMPDPNPEFGQCVHKVARDAQNPARLYAQNHRGVYRSDDHGETWTSIADGLPTDFGFTVVTHPHSGDNLWLVPVVSDGERIPPDGVLQVQHSTDAGASWTTRTAGLPSPSYTAVMRDAAGTDGAEQPGLYFGTRNGDVFASTDEGATFERIAEQLPDVLVVRAAQLS